MNFEFMTIDTPLPPCMPFPRALTGFPVSSTAKVMYCRMLDAMLSKGQEDENGIPVSYTHLEILNRMMSNPKVATKYENMLSKIPALDRWADSMIKSMTGSEVKYRHCLLYTS